MPKLIELKSFVYATTDTTTTKQLKKQEPELVKGLDLRLKKNWECMVTQLKSAPPTLIPNSNVFQGLDGSDEIYNKSLRRMEQLRKEYFKKYDKILDEGEDQETTDALISELDAIYDRDYKQIDDECAMEIEQFKLESMQRIYAEHDESMRLLEIEREKRNAFIDSLVGLAIEELKEDYAMSVVHELQQNEALKQMGVNTENKYEDARIELNILLERHKLNRTESSDSSLMGDSQLSLSLIKAQHCINCNKKGIDENQMEEIWTRGLLELQF
jgi:hypothetical protein